jgi:hypothetical protein
MPWHGEVSHTWPPDSLQPTESRVAATATELQRLCSLTDCGVVFAAAWALQQAGVRDCVDTGAGLPIHRNEFRPCGRNQQQQRRRQLCRWHFSSGACYAWYRVPGGCCAGGFGCSAGEFGVLLWR